MKKFVLILLGVIIVACDSEDAGDCFQTAGGIVTEEVSVSSFESILVNRDVEVVLKQEAEFKVVIETGENLLNDVKAIVVGNELQLTDDNTCNFTRDFGITKIYVSAPDIKNIRSSTQYDISSNGVLMYDDLTITSENFNSPDSFAVGDFRLELDSESFTVISNNISAFYISGLVENLDVRFFSGSSRFESANLLANNVIVSHRGTNDMIVNPQSSISGVIRSTGDVRAVNQPATIDVEELYTGRLIFEN